MSNNLNILTPLILLTLLITSCNSPTKTLSGNSIHDEGLTRINYITINGPITGELVTFAVYLPPSYFIDEYRKFPVVYQLHGANQSYDGEPEVVADFFESVWKQDIWEQAIVVFPDGKRTSMWSDSFDGKVNVETNIIKEIIPYIDNTFRTKIGMENRFIQGFSMGGFGAFKLIGKYPHLFSKAMSLDGALHSWETFNTMRPNISSKMFNNNQAFYDETTNPRAILALNAKHFKDKKRLHISYGTMPITGQLKYSFTSFLDKNNITYEVANQLNSGHRLKTILKELGESSFRFYE